MTEQPEKLPGQDQPECKLREPPEQPSSEESTEKKQVMAELQLDWVAGPDMPFAMDGPSQAVVIDGTVYVGGGESYSWPGPEKTVMAYSIETCQWHTLPQYRTKGFAMTTYRNKLVLVGGRVGGLSDSKELGEWQPDSNQWTRPYPPMSRTRYNASAISYKDYLVVAGGYSGHRLIDSVEVLDVSNMQWSAGPPTPVPWEGLVSTTIGDTWYLMGGHCDKNAWCSDVYYIALEDIISYETADLYNSLFSMWGRLPPPGCRYASPLSIGGVLLAVGGMEVKTYEPLSTIQRFDRETSSWVKVGDLPHTLWNCACIAANKQVHIMGGSNRHAIKEMFIANI